MEAAGFADLVNCVFADDGDVLDKLEWLFEDSNELHRITKAGKQLVDSQHTIRQRSQVFQWYTLHKRLKTGQRIVQPGPFLPLTIVDEHSGINNGHVNSCGVDRLLMKQGDEKLRLGNYDDAERHYRRCLNYQQPDIPEAKFRLILCLLHKGDFKAALASLREQFPSHRLVSEKEVEPDPTEWAWFIVALLCCGKNREAALRADQFTSLQNEELNRVRNVIQMMRGQRKELILNVRPTRRRASVHQPLNFPIDEWLETLGRMLKACGQLDTASTLARMRSHLDLLEVNDSELVSNAKQHSFGNTFLKYNLAAGSRLSRFAQRITSRSQHLMSRMRGGSPSSSSWNAGDERAAVARLLQKEEMRFGVLVGASKDSWLTDAFMRGIHDNPNRPSAVFVNYDSSDFRQLHKQFVDDTIVKFRYVPDECETLLVSDENPDFIAVNCRDIHKYEQGATVKATLVLLGHINNQAGSEYFRAMLSDENYVLVLHEPEQFDGYAAFRRIALKRQVPHQTGIASVVC